MGAKSKIEWTDASWNPFIAINRATQKRGWICTKPSAGCANCYAETMNIRLGNGLDYSIKSLSQVDIKIHDDTLQDPIRWKRPRLIFVCSMTDLFHEAHDESAIQAVFTIMARAKSHVFQILTKRPKRMKEILLGWDCAGLTLREGYGCILPNVWLGVTAENQSTANSRIDDLLSIPSHVRFVSYEPALEPVKLRLPMMLPDLREKSIGTKVWPWMEHIDQVICGGESGPNARPMNTECVRSALAQCRDAGTAFFFKQWGQYLPVGQGGLEMIGERHGSNIAIFNNNEQIRCNTTIKNREKFAGVGKKRAGHELDNKIYQEYPAQFYQWKDSHDETTAFL